MIHLETHRGRALLYYYIFVSSRAATILGSPASWGRLVACGRLLIGPLSAAGTMPEEPLRLAAMRGPIVNRPGRLRTAASRRVANPPQDAILPHVRRTPMTRA